MQYQPLHIYFDSRCPLCMKEMQHLKKHDENNLLTLHDIHAHDFKERFPHINFDDANTILHGQLSNGEMVYGLDVTYEAWKRIHRGWLIKPLRWRITRPIADSCYRFFARHRFTISRILTGKARLECDDNCELITENKPSS